MSELMIKAYQKVSWLNTLTDKEVRALVKEEAQLPVRRLDRFTLIALLTVHRLLSNNRTNSPLGKKLSLYSVAEYLSVDLFQTVITNMRKKEAIRPFDFIATVGNAANFYLSKEFSIKGPNIFIGASESPILKSCLLAEVDLYNQSCEQAIIVVWLVRSESLCCYAFVVELYDNALSEQYIEQSHLSIDDLVKQNINIPLPFVIKTSF